MTMSEGEQLNRWESTVQPALSILEQIYDALRSMADVEREYLGAEETNHLEFKRKSNPTGPALDDDDKKNFSKAISAFSNADGGLLIWGIATRKADGREQAERIQPIASVQDFAERLRSSLLETTSPVNHKVRVKPLSNQDGQGIVVCLVPPGESVPYRSMRGAREYWVRMDGRTNRMEHFQIRDMMLRSAVPELVLAFSVVGGSGQEGRVRIRCQLQNVGRAVAKYAGFFVRLQGGSVGTVSQALVDTSELNATASVQFTMPAGQVLHPAPAPAVFAGDIDIVVLKGQPLCLHGDVYCEGMAARSLTYTVSH
jgi:hypothetical protein